MRWEIFKSEQKMSQSIGTTGKIIIYTSALNESSNSLRHTIYALPIRYTYGDDFRCLLCALIVVNSVCAFDVEEKMTAHNIVQITTKHAFFSLLCLFFFIHFFPFAYIQLSEIRKLILFVCVCVCAHKLNHPWRWYVHTQKIKSKQRRMNTIVSSIYKTPRNGRRRVQEPYIFIHLNNLFVSLFCPTLRLRFYMQPK